MLFSDRFVSATKEYNDFSKNVPSPYFRKSFILEQTPVAAEITICGLGFYRLWINGDEITKGILAPYISNPNDIVYYDRYDLSSFLKKGKNTVGIQLGNGLLNNPGGFVWDFEAADYRSAPKVAFAIEWKEPEGHAHCLEADATVKTAASPLYFDDLRCGERYDARLEIPGWNLPTYDDSGWSDAIPATAPDGEKKLCSAPPVRPTGKVLSPVRVFQGELADFKGDYKKSIPVLFEPPGSRRGYIFDFGKNRTGIIRLKIKGSPGQRLEIQFAEYIDQEGKLNYSNIKFYPDGYAQRDVLICSGREDVFEPWFTYHGASCCLITGLTDEQARPELVDFLVCNSSMETVGGFSCSDQTINTLFSMARASDLSNFIYFPNDCPHREKNGWTGDAALSAQHLFMNYNVADSIREWLCNFRKAQREDGALPGIVPTFHWGYDNGPSWDICLTEMTYRLYRYTGCAEALAENADAIYRYLLYAFSRRDASGIIGFGLGDWCSVDWKQQASRDFTCSVTMLDLCRKAAFIFDTLGQTERKQLAQRLYAELFDAVRTRFINPVSCVADTRCQTSQAMALFYNVFLPEEEDRAFRVLIDIIHENGDFLDVGILGARVLFHVLCDRGYAALAFHMVSRPEWPSYGHFISQGLTTLPEEFTRDDAEWDSRNHHMFGDIANLFIAKLAGLNYLADAQPGKPFDPQKDLILSPAFVPGIRNANAFYDHVRGRISVSWERTDDRIVLTANYPAGFTPILSETVFRQWDGEALRFYQLLSSEVGASNTVFVFRELSFRLMEEGDIDGVRKFFDLMGERSSAFFNVNRGNEKRIMEYFENGKPDHRFYVASSGNEIISLAFTWDNDRSVPWFGIAVRDDWQGNGVGGRMLDFVFARLQRLGYGGLLLRTAKSNLAAQRLYEKKGFEKLGDHPSGEILYLRRFDI